MDIIDKPVLLSYVSVHIVYGISVPFASKPLNQQMITSWIGDANLQKAAKEESDANDLLSRPEVSHQAFVISMCDAIAIFDISLFADQNTRMFLQRRIRGFFFD